MMPASEQELADLIRRVKAPLWIVGGGTRAIGRIGDGDVVQSGGMSGISLYEPGALTVVAGAGTPLAVIEAALTAEGQRLPFEVPDLRGLLGRKGTSTIGGVVSANASGPRRIQAGACRDSLIGIRFVDGSGNIVKNGGRVMKNVTGYDLVKLLAGAHGTLGVLTEVAFKVLPRPEAEATLVAEIPDPETAVAAMSAALGSPYEVTGAAYSAGQVRLRVEGMQGSVTYRKAALAKLLGQDWDHAEGEASATLWREIRDVTSFAGVAGAVWRISIKPSDMPGVLGVLGADAVAICDWGGGLIWALVPDADDAGAAKLRGHLAGIGGHATLMRGSDRLLAEVPAFHPEAASLAALSAGLRAKFDPRNILNPGLMQAGG